jgi:hypothetical protein
MTFNDDYFKMSIITTIQAMADKIGADRDFDELWPLSYAQLVTIREEYIKRYNEMIGS